MIIDGHIRRDTPLVFRDRGDCFVSKTPSGGTFVIGGVVDPNLAVCVRSSRWIWGGVIRSRGRLLRLLESARSVRGLLVVWVGDLTLRKRPPRRWTNTDCAKFDCFATTQNAYCTSGGSGGAYTIHF